MACCYPSATISNWKVPFVYGAYCASRRICERVSCFKGVFGHANVVFLFVLVLNFGFVYEVTPEAFVADWTCGFVSAVAGFLVNIIHDNMLYVVRVLNHP